MGTKHSELELDQFFSWKRVGTRSDSERIRGVQEVVSDGDWDGYFWGLLVVVGALYFSYSRK